MSVSPMLATVWTALCFGIYLAAWLPGFHPAWAAMFWTSRPPAPGAMAAAGAGDLVAAGWVATIDLAALAAGSPTGRWLCVRGRVTRLVLGLTLILPLAALGLGLAGLFRPRFLVGATLAAAIAGGRPAWAARPRAGTLRGFPVWVIGFLLLPSLLRALAPQIEYDALRYHFALPHSFLLHGRVVAMEPRPLCHLPLGAEMFLALGMAAGGDPVAQLLNWQWLPLLLWLAHRAHRLVHRDGPLLTLGALGLAATPLFSLLGGGGFTDGFACVALGAALLLILERRRGHAAAAALLVGAAGGAKFSMVPLGLAWLLPWGATALVPTAAAWSGPIAPWLAKNWLLTGSPFGGIALTAWWPAFDQAETVTQLYQAARWTPVGNPAVWLALPRFLLHEGAREGHEISPLLVLALPALAVGWAGVSGPGRRLLLAAATGMAAWMALGGGQVRYLAPLLLPVSVAASMAWVAPARGVILAAALLGWVRVCASAGVGAQPLPVVLGRQPRIEYLSRFLTPRGLYMSVGGWLAEHPETGRPYVAGDIKAYYWPRDPLVDTEYNLPALFRWSRDAANGRRLAVTFRQHRLGCVVHRMEGALTFQEITGGYRWSDRMLRVVQDFLLSHTVERYRLERPDQDAFYRIRVVTASPPAFRAAASHWFAVPYAELLTRDADRALEAGRLAEARAAYRDLARRFPGWVVPPLRLAEAARRSGLRGQERDHERAAENSLAGLP